MRTRALMIAVAALAAVLSFALLAGCGSKPTLEKYFEDNPELWTQVEDQVKNMAGEMFAMNMSVEGNQINQVMTYTETFPADSVNEMKKYFTEQEGALREQLANGIAIIEQQTDLEGITWAMTYNNGDGTEIFSMTIDGSEATAGAATEAPAGAPADTSEDTSAAA